MLTVLLLASLAVVLYTSIRQSNNIKEAAQSVSHTEKVLLQLKKLVLLAYENETGSRGFIITGQQKFLEPLHRSEKDFHTELKTLQQLLTGSSTHKQHLDSIELYIRKRIDYSRLTVNTRIQHGMAAAMQMVESGQGKQYSDKIMELGGKIEALELSALEQKKAARNQKLFHLNLILYSILLAMLVLALAFLYNIRNEIRRRKETSHQLELLNKQLNEAHDAIYVVDANRKITSWNKGAEYLYGYSSKEAIGKDSNALLQTVISENEISKVLEEISKTDYWTGEIKRVTKAGKQVYVRSSSTTIRNEKGIITGYVAVNVDITLQKELSAQLHHLANLVEHSSDAIMSRGMDKRIISWNEGSEKLLGYTKEEAIGKTALELGMIRFTSAEIEEMENAIIENGSWKGEKQYYHKNGYSFIGDVTANAVKNEEGNVTSIVFIIKDISLRKNREEQLRQSNVYLEERIRERSNELVKSEKRFRLLIEHSAEGIALTDEYSNLIYRSPAAYRITGYTSDEFAIGLAHPEDLPLMQAKFADALKQPGLPIEFTARVQHASGHYYWCEGTLTNLLHVDGINAVVANFRDVTLRKISEQQLKASEEQFRNTLDHMLEGAQLIGFDRRYIYVNDAVVKQSKYTKEELLDGRTFMELYPGVEQTALYKVLEKCFHDRVATHLESEFEFPDKAKHWFEMSVQPIPEGIFILSVDITDRKLAEEKRMLFTSIVNSSDDAIISNTIDGTIISWNKGAELMFGYVENEIINKNIRLLIPEELHEEEDQIAAVITENKTFKHPETIRVTKDGRHIDVSLTISPIVDTNNQIIGISTIARDITAQNENKRRILQSEENLKTIFENTSEGFVLLDVDGTIKALNKTATESIVINTTEENAIGKSVFEFVEEERIGDVRTIITDVLKGKRVEYDKLYKQKDKPNVWINYAFNPVITDNTVTGICITGRDISELRRIEQERLQMKVEEQKKMAHAMLQGQEKERNDIGQELHDNVNQILVSTNLILSMAKKTPDKTDEMIASAMANLHEVINENRKVAHLFVAPNLEKESLLTQLQRLASTMLEPASISTSFTIDTFREDLLNNDQKLNLYRIAQEQCTNIVKHANASTVQFELATANGIFTMIISDNGVGAHNNKKHNGIGLQNINGRLNLLNGSSSVTTAKGEGYALKVMIPL